MTYQEICTAITALEAASTPETRTLLAQLLMERGEMKRRAHNPEGALEDAQRAMTLDPTLAAHFNGKESIS